MTILCRPLSWRCPWRFLKTWPAARPIFKAVSAVTGSTFAVPRTPSVPKIFLWAVISIALSLAELFLASYFFNRYVNRFRVYNFQVLRDLHLDILAKFLFFGCL